jgi:hypothetical protein
MVIDKNSVDHKRKTLPQEERDLPLGRDEASSDGQYVGKQLFLLSVFYVCTYVDFEDEIFFLGGEDVTAR